MLSRAQQASLLTSYEPVNTGDICINADKEWFANSDVPMPTRLEDLMLPQYRGLLVTQDPVASSPGLGFLLGTIAHFGEGQWQKFWAALKGYAHIAPDWTTAYTIDFSGSSGNGKYPLVVSYGSSPPAEVLYADPSNPLTEPTTSVIESTCFRQTEYVGVLRGSARTTAGETLVKYLLGKRFQESMPLSLFVFPVNQDAVLPDLFVKFAVRAKNPLTISPQEIEQNREKWLKEWRALLL
jgi:thiamine transport system substrate-binding protein